MLAATLGYSLVFGVLNGLWWVMILRGPYWLYRRRGHRDAGKLWTPWGLTIAGVIAVISTDLTPFLGPVVMRVGCRGQHAIGGRMLLGFGS
jgi:hypothetical protein